MQTPQTQATRAQLDAQARLLIRQQAIEDRQIIYSNTISSPAAQTVNVPLRPVGLVLGLWVEIAATIKNSDGANAVTPTDFGPANLLKQVTFVDLNNYTRHQTDGKHIAMLNALRNRRPYGSALLSNGAAQGYGFDNPMAFGNNSFVWFETASIAAGATGTMKALFYVPISYSRDDLRGSIYAGIINATMQLGLTFNPNPGVASGDTTGACYTGSASVTIQSADVTVTQHYLDQLPVGKDGYPILPISDTNTVYELKSSFLTGLANGQDFAIPFTNYRDFLSALLIYNDGTATNGGRPKQSQGVNANTNYLALQTANFYNPIKNTEYLQSALTRNVLGTDLPPGCYYFPFRSKPISTTQQGNQQLILNPANLGSVQAPYVIPYFEDFGIVSALTQAGSLASS